MSLQDCVAVRHLLRYPAAEPGGVSSMVPAWVAWANRHGARDAWVDPPPGSGSASRDWIRRYAARLAELRLPPRVLAHAHHPLTALAWRLAPAAGARPLMLTVHGLTDLGPAPGPLVREAAAAADLVTVPSPALAAALAACGIRPLVLANAYDLDRFRPRPRIPLRPPYRLLVVARLVPEKGVDVALRALARLRRQGVAAVLDIVGDGPARPALEQLARELSLGPTARFHGFSARPEYWLARAHVLLVPSREEAFGNVLVEAGASGLPVAASRVGGIPGQIREGENGLLVPPDDPAALAAAVLRLTADPAAWEAMRRTARRLACRYGLDTGLPRYRTLYRMLAVPAAGTARLKGV